MSRPQHIASVSLELGNPSIPKSNTLPSKPLLSRVGLQSELPWPIPRNSVESDHRCTSSGLVSSSNGQSVLHDNPVLV